MTVNSTNSDEFVTLGTWWLPDNSKNKVSGILKFSENKAMLELNGSFENLHGFQHPSDQILIHGIGGKEEKITLYNCYFTEVNGTASKSNVTYIFSAFFLGVHFQNKDEIKFSRINVKFSKLRTWIQTHGFSSDLEDSKIWVNRYTPPEDIEVKIDDSLLLKIIFQFSSTFDRDNTKKSITEQDISIDIEVKTELTIFDFFKKIHHLRHFISLGLMAPEYITALKGFTEKYVQELNDQKVMIPIEIYFSQGKLPDNSTVNETNMLFPFEFIQDNFEDFLKKWFELIDSIGLVGNLYFGTLYNFQSYGADRFFNIVATLESFHRIFRDDEIWTKEEFDKLKNSIGNAIEKKEDREAILGKIKYANELTLRNRLKQIIQEFDYVLTKEKGYDNSFIDLVVETRNYFAHYDPDSKEKAITDDNLPLFIKKLRVIVETCLLFEIGMNKDTIIKLIQKSMIQKNIR